MTTTKKTSKKTATEKSTTKKARTRKAPAKKKAPVTGSDKLDQAPVTGSDKLDPDVQATKDRNEKALDGIAESYKPASRAKAAKAPTAGSRLKKATGAKPAPAANGTRRKSLLDHAADAIGNTPIGAKELCDAALAAGWTTKGKTPQATLYAAMIREIRDKGDGARFKKTGRGLFVAGKGS